jgi:3-dehydroquinate synthase
MDDSPLHPVYPCSLPQSFSVSFDFPVIFTRALFEPSNPEMVGALCRLNERRVHRAAAFVDSNVAKCHPDLLSRVASYFAAHSARITLAEPPQVVPGGEVIKADTQIAHDLIRRFAELGLCRHSYVLAVGGGAVLDAVGFATALFHRGLRLIRVPTTVLAQNDVGVGVKNALNFAGGKNLVGTFSPPFAVLNDFDVLRTLSDRDWIGGISEAFKVAIIRDAEFFRWLCGHAAELRRRDERAMEHLIRRCAELHLEHIRTSGDPFELGQARPLDFGHWSAHKLEAMSDYRVGHGQAVATGIALDSAYATAKGWIAEQEYAAIFKGLIESGFSFWHDELDARAPDGSLEILQGLRDFQEHLGGELVLTFPKGIGSAVEASEIDPALVGKAIERLRHADRG